MSCDPFDEPLSVHRWACDEIEKFKASAQAFVDTYHPELFSELDVLRSGELIHGYKFEEKLPDELRRLGYYVVTNLRNALDQAMHAASVQVGTAKPNKTNFPVGDDAKSLASQLARSPSYKGIPPNFMIKFSRSTPIGKRLMSRTETLSFAPSSKSPTQISTARRSRFG